MWFRDIGLYMCVRMVNRIKVAILGILEHIFRWLDLSRMERDII